MMSTSPTMMRSSLEEMLENLRKRDEEQPKDIPPALPSRPTSRARLPSARRSLPVGFKVSGDDSKRKPDDDVDEREKKLGVGPWFRRKNSFGNSKKKMKSDQSPYNGVEDSQSQDDENSVNGDGVTPTSKFMIEWEDNLDYFIKKVILLSFIVFFKLWNLDLHVEYSRY